MSEQLEDNKSKRVLASSRSWYWIIDYGKEKYTDNGAIFWNKWAENKLSQAEQGDLLKHIQKNMNDSNATTPSPHDMINFWNTIWLEDVSFKKFIFPTETYFIDAEFQGEAIFVKAEFQGEAIFMLAGFQGEANFFSAIFEKEADFNAVNFSDTAFFNHILLNKLSFRLSSFTRLSGIDAKLFIGAISNEDKKDYESYSVLKQAMSQQHQHEEELLFFAAEMKAKSSNTGNDNYFLIKIYYTISNYGLSLKKPLIALMAIIVIFVCIYSFIFNFSIADSIQISIEKSIPFIPQDTLSFEYFKKLPAYISMVEDKTILCFLVFTKLQIFFSLIFIFLIGLALRNKLRL